MDTQVDSLRVARVWLEMTYAKLCKSSLIVGSYLRNGITLISHLFQKVSNPSSAAEYRPIACCNTLHKGISKLLCTRPKEVLPNLVHSNQSSFTEGRLIGHNVMICQDQIRLYQRKNVSPKCLFKIDLRKA